MNTFKLVDTTNVPRRWGDQFKGKRVIYMCSVQGCKNSILTDGGDTVFMGIACEKHKSAIPIAFIENPKFLSK